LKELAEECQVSKSVASRVAEETYGQVCAQTIEDGEVTPDERAKLQRLAQELSLAPSRAQEIESSLKERRYKGAVDKVLTDGTVTEAEKQELETLRRAFGINRTRAAEVAGKSGADGYVALFRLIIADGRITNEEWQELERYRHALGLSSEQAQAILRPQAPALYKWIFAHVVSDQQITEAEREQLRRFRILLGLSDPQANDLVNAQAVDLYREVFYEIIQDGELTSQEELRLHNLQKQLGLSNEIVAEYLSELAQCKKLSEYRQGALPSVATRRFLESGEICHWFGECTFAWETSKGSKNVCGELMITSQRVIFTSQERSFEFSPTKIVDIEAYTNGLKVMASSTKGVGNYLTADARKLEAILVGIVRKHKYLLSENFSCSRSRHIPDCVKREVWFRDGGKCVRCAADQYLEFDHVIPHTKGGANTVNNIQILCRRCNGIKSDRI
jgi:uncharacterized tellurite resistance protein B-like protein